MERHCPEFHDLFAQSLTGQLSVEERETLAAHLAACPDCAKAYQDLQTLESDMTALFAATQPDALFESRLLTRLRFRTPKRIHPLVQRIAVGLAASIVLGGFGYFGQKVLESQSVGTSSLLRNTGIENGRKTSYVAVSSLDSQEIAGVSIAPTTQPGRETRALSEVQRGDVNFGWYAMPDYDLRAAKIPTTGSISAGDLYFAMGDRFESPQSNAERWDFSGGSGGALNWNSYARPRLTTAVPYRPAEGAKETTIEGRPVMSGVALHEVSAVKEKTSDSSSENQSQKGVPLATDANANLLQEQTQTAVIQTKIIRNGEVEFEVDSFDSSVATVAKIVNEGHGYIGTTSSEKLPNGKVKGVLIVRVPPENLDTLILKLRGLGDLKRQNLSANDVTKQYYDLSSELRAAKAMQERLLEIIKTGNAQVKDLLSVEKELATWRGKIEKLEGEVRYYDNLVSLSTLNIALTERDIRTAAAIKEIENADAGIEVSDVEAARASAIASIEEANGRIIEAELKKLDAGQFAAKVIADVPAESAGTVIDRLKQIGKVARLEISRKQTTPDNSSPQTGAKVERGDTHIVASFYNLANVAPRQTVTMQMASDDVAKTYAAILAQIEKANGRVVTSNLQQPRPDETSGTIQFELPSNVADLNLQQLQSSGLVLQMSVSENPDTANVTSAKRGFNLTLISSRAIAPRQTLNLTTEANDVAQTSASLTTFVQSIGGRIVDTNQSTATGGSSNASLRVEVPVSKLSELMGKIESSTKIRAQQSALRTQVPEGPAARALVDLKLQTPDAIVSSENGFFPSLRRGISTSVAGLLWSLQLIIIGVCLIAPWALLLWGGIKFWKRRRAT